MNDGLSPLLVEQLLNMGFDESVTFSKNEHGLHIRRTARCGDVSLDQVVSTVEIECSKYDVLGESLYRMAVELRSVKKCGKMES